MDCRKILIMRFIKYFFLFLAFSFLSVKCSADSLGPSLIDNNTDISREIINPGQGAYDHNLNKFSSYIVVFGDLQTYTMGRYIDYYKHSCNWIRKQYDEGININCILQVGDVTQNNTDSQWSLFKQVSDTIGSVIPYFVCLGNHDYSWSSSKIFNRSYTKINNYAHFPLTDEKIICYFKEGDLSNYIARLDNKDNFSLIALEFGPRKEVVNWAVDYVKGHPEQLFILMTHEWLNSEGQRIYLGSSAEQQLKGYSSYSTPEEVWNQLVWPNDNILCVLCGHAGFNARLFSENCKGRQVPQILFNLQYVVNGGNGLIQIWELPENSNTIIVRIYDTFKQNWYKSEKTTFSF